jgi:hypothetical protein
MRQAAFAGLIARGRMPNYVWRKRDDILDSLAAYCQRIADLGR